jgi:hypothetical protein
MTAAVARFATQDDHLLLDGYARFCHRLGLADRGLRDRLRLARLFLAEHPDLDAWLAGPLGPGWPTCTVSRHGR